MKRKVTEIVKDCKISFSGLNTTVNLNILPLGSYDILIGMYWLETHRAIIDCLHKICDCMDNEGKRNTVKGIYRPITTRQISAIQLQKCFRKICEMYAIKFNEIEREKLKTTMEQLHILKES